MISNKRQKNPKRLKSLKHESSIRNSALDILSRREHTRLELTRKLKAKEFSTNDIEELLTILEKEGLQSDDRFVESYVHSRCRRGFGPIRIKHELQQRGVSSDLINMHVDLNDKIWLQNSFREYEKKFGASGAKTIQDKAKCMRFLQSRGFTNDIIRKTMDEFTGF